MSAALHYCSKHTLNPPRWLVVEAAEQLCVHLEGHAPRGRGRSAGIVKGYFQDALHYARWDAVIEVRENCEQLRRTAKQLRKLKNPKARGRLKEIEKLIREAKAGFKCAARLLLGSPAYAGTDAIKQSYREVEQNMKNPVTAMRYLLLDPDFVRMIGAHTGRTEAGKKIVSFHDRK